METQKTHNYLETFSNILADAVREPGLLEQAFTNFHSYSLGNQMLALSQMHLRGIPVGPIASYRAWNAKGRQVKKGAKAISLLMPVSSRKVEVDDDGKETVKYITFGRFMPKNHWFTLSQTYVPCRPCKGKGGTVGDSPLTDKVCNVCGGSGEDPNAPEYNPGKAPGFDFDLVLKAFKLEEAPFASTNGNMMGYAQGNKIAVNPLDVNKVATKFHEIAHILLGHTKEGNRIVDDATRQKNLKEVEAEGVAMLCLSALGLEGVEYCRGYIQNWLNGAEIPPESAQKIITVADKILKTGTGIELKGKGGEAE